MLLYFARLLRLRVTVGRRSALAMTGISRLPLRVRLGDLDQLGHVNNGVYLSMMDVGRVDLLVRAGFWAKLTSAGFYPVVAAQTITYRKSLRRGQRFELETRLAGFHGKAVFVEQRFVVGGEIYARAFVKARFLKRAGGTVSIEELNGLAGTDLRAFPLDGWVRDWADGAVLPNTHTDAPSVWSPLPG